MPITAEQRATRRRYVGASEVPAILGLSPYQTAYDLWAEKSGLVEDQPLASDAADLGTYFETPLLTLWGARHDMAFDSNIEAYHPTVPHFRATLDAISNTGHIYEVKTTGQVGPVRDDWAEPAFPEENTTGDDSAGVPVHVLAQVQAQLACAEDAKDDRYVNTTGAVVLAAIGGRGLWRYWIPRDDEAIEAIEGAVRLFWEHVETGAPPPDSPPSLAMARRMRRAVGKIGSVNADLVRAWEDAKAAEKAAREAREASEAMVLAALGDAEAADLGDGRHLAYREQTRKGYVAKDSTFRVLRIKKGWLE